MDYKLCDLFAQLLGTKCPKANADGGRAVEVYWLADSDESTYREDAGVTTFSEDKIKYDEGHNNE